MRCLSTGEKIIGPGVGARSSNHGQHDVPAVSGAAVFPKKYSLPGPEQQAPVRKRHRLTGTRKRHLDVTRHVVGTFCRMFEFRVAFRNQSIEPPFEIATRGGIGVFHDQQRATRVLAKNRDYAAREAARSHMLRDQRGDLVHTLAARSELNRFLIDGHDLGVSPAMNSNSTKR